MTIASDLPKSGEIWNASLDPIRGVEQAGYRPVLVISNDWFNQLGTGLVLVAPITGTDRNLRYQVKIPAGEGGITKDSVVMCEQVRSLDISRFRKRRGITPPETLARVRDAVAMMISDDTFTGW